MKELVSNPWPNAIKNIPADFDLVCTYELFIGIDTVFESAFYRNIGDSHELWIITCLDSNDAINQTFFKEDSRGVLCSDLALSLTCEKDDLLSSYEILQGLFIIRRNFDRPVSFLKPGLLDKEMFSRLLEEIFPKNQ